MYGTKWLLKEAMRQQLPAENLRQRKQGFSVPIHDWFQGPLGELTVDLVRSGLTGTQALNANAVAALLGDHRQGRARHGHLLWRVLVFEVWRRVCYDQQPSGAPEVGL